MKVLKFIFSFFTAFVVLFLLYLMFFLVLSSSKAFAEEAFFLVLISEKNKTAKVVNRHPSMKVCQKNTENLILDSFDFLKKEEKKGNIKICCFNKKQTENYCLDLSKSSIVKGRGLTKDI